MIDLADITSRIDRPLDVTVGVPIILSAYWWFDFSGQRWGVRRPTV